MKSAAVDIVIAAIFEKTTCVYGDRGVRYVYMEACQNIYLEVTALGLGTVAIGAFYDDEVAKTVGLKHDEKPLCVIPVGVPKHVYRVSKESIARYVEAKRCEKGLCQ